jgi:hypothetical protein
VVPPSAVRLGLELDLLPQHFTVNDGQLLGLLGQPPDEPDPVLLRRPHRGVTELGVARGEGLTVDARVVLGLLTGDPDVIPSYPGSWPGV